MVGPRTSTTQRSTAVVEAIERKARAKVKRETAERLGFVSAAVEQIVQRNSGAAVAHRATLLGLAPTEVAEALAYNDAARDYLLHGPITSTQRDAREALDARAIAHTVRVLGAVNEVP